MPNKYKMVFYDLDGTLLNSFEDIKEALNYGLSQNGLPTHSIETVKTFVGNGVVRLVECALAPQDQHRLNEVLPLVENYYKTHPAHSASLYPGVPETLARIREMDISQAILTNKPHHIALESCAQMGLSPLVNRVQGEDASHPLKPDPEAALGIAREMGIAPKDCVIVGDGNADAYLAQAAGIEMIGCTWGVNTRPQMAALGLEKIIDRMEQLLPLVSAGN